MATHLDCMPTPHGARSTFSSSSQRKQVGDKKEKMVGVEGRAYGKHRKGTSRSS